MEGRELTAHHCNQVLRFTQVERWDDLTEDRKVQLAYNVGAMASRLELNKEDGYDRLSDMQQGKIPVKVYHQHVLRIMKHHRIAVDVKNLAKPF